MKDYEEILNSRISEPAAILTYKDGLIRMIGLNDKFISEMWMNTSREEFLSANVARAFDDENLQIFTNAVKRCIDAGEDQTVETWRILFSDCCGYDRVCLKSRIVFLEKNGDEAVIYERIRNITNERKTAETLAEVEYRYKQTSEQVNIYNWEYYVATKEMRPCFLL